MNHYGKPLLQITRLSKHFGGLPALAGGELRGRAGPGHGPHRPQRRRQDHPDQLPHRGHPARSAGKSCFDGVNIAGLPAHRIARLGISRTFQNLRLFPRLSVLDNVLCGLTAQAGDSLFQALLRPPGLRHRERRLRLTAMEALDTFGLADKAGLPAGVLPYGDKKRLEMARAFVSQPRLDPAG